MVQTTQDISGAVGAVVRGALDAMRRSGRWSASTVAAAVDAPGRTLTRRAVLGAFTQPSPVGDPATLARALGEAHGSPALTGATATAMAARLARRVGPLKFLTRRAPMWMIAGAVPALHASVTRGARDVGLVASHLVSRARAAGLEPDPERVRRATIQLLSRSRVNPDVEPGHTGLLLSWLRRGLRAALPLARGITTRDPDRLAAAAANVSPSVLV